jgi:hypothetical protein
MVDQPDEEEGALSTLANPYGLTGGYAKMYADMQKQYEAKNAAQQQYLASLQQRENALQSQGMSDYDRTAMLAQITGALLSPTKSGGLGGTLESFGNAATAAAGPLSKQAEAQRQRQQQIQQLQDARAKMGIEMAGGMDPQSAMSLLKAQQDQEKQPTEFEELLKRPELTDEQRRAAVLQKLGINREQEPEEYRNVVRPDGSTITILKKGNQTLDPVTREPLDLNRISEEQRASAVADRQAQATEYGVPVLNVDPYASLPQKDREKARIARYNADTRVLQKQADDVPDAALRDEILNYKTFVALNNENRSTGAMWGKVPNYSPSSQQMAGIESKLTIGVGKDLKGSASDRDVAMFGKAVPSTYKDFEANANIATFGILKNQTELERRAFMRDYLAVNKTLEGADRKWNQYLQDNPFFKYPEKFDPSKLDIKKLQLNDQRQSYSDYFRQKAESGATPVTRDAQGRLVIGGQ